LDVDAVHERAGDLRHVALDLRRRAVAFPPEVVGESTRTGLRADFAISASRDRNRNHGDIPKKSIHWATIFAQHGSTGACV
jgi:hypothetical protein